MLSPAFAAETQEYTAITTKATDKITAVPVKSGAVIEIKVNDEAHANGTSAAWEDGENEITVKVTYGTTEKEYAVTVTYENTHLSTLTVGNLSLTPSFDPEKTEYDAESSDATNKITATAAKEDAVVEITVDGEPHTNGESATWAVGENTVVITVTDGSSARTYTVTVTKTTE